MKKEKDNIEYCGQTIIHEDIVKEINERMLKDETVMALAEFFKVFGDSTRLKIYMPFNIKMCVCDLAAYYL